jgi:dihydroflavonol-4-reductase
MNLNVLVIGGSGHIGNALSRAFLDAGCRVSVAGRRAEPPQNLSGLPVRYMAGDGDRPGQFENWATGHDLVVDAAAPYPLRAFSPLGQQLDPIVQAQRRTEQLLGAISESGARLVYISSFVTCVRPQTSLEKVRLQLLRLLHPYIEVKQLIESQILDAARRGLRVVIVNPTYCLGPWDLRDLRQCTIPLLLRGEVPASVTQMLNVIDVRDVAAAAIKALQTERYGEPLLLNGHDILPPALHSLICEIGGAAPPGYSMPTSIAAVGAYGLDIVLGIMGESSPFASGPMLLSTMFDYLPRSGDLRSLGVIPRPLRATVAESIGWYRQIGYC